MEKTKSCCYDSIHNPERPMSISEIEFRKHFQKVFLDETRRIRYYDNTAVLMLKILEAEANPEPNIDLRPAPM